jgi:hypothetical protein
VLGGLVIATIFGLQALAAYQVMQRVEASSAVTLAKGLDLLARLFSPAGAAAQLVDPRNQQLYVQAREQLVQGAGVGGLGLLIALIGLLAAALWHPTFSPPGVAASRNAAGAMASVVLLTVAGVYLLNFVNTNVSTLSSAADGLGQSSSLQTRTFPPPASAVRSAGEGAAPGVTAPLGSLPAHTTAAPAAPTVSQQSAPPAVFYRADPFGPVKVDAGGIYTVRLPTLQKGTLVRAVATIAFNNRLSSLEGTPDITLTVTGPSGTISSLARARSGAQISFQAPGDGEYAIVLDNTYSRVTAKQVSLQFLQP